MKRDLRRLLILIFLISLIPSCNLLEDCKTCKEVRDDGVNPPTKGVGIPSCGDKLEERESADAVTIGGVTTYWECS